MAEPVPAFALVERVECDITQEPAVMKAELLRDHEGHTAERRTDAMLLPRAEADKLAEALNAQLGVRELPRRLLFFAAVTPQVLITRQERAQKGGQRDWREERPNCGVA